MSKDKKYLVTKEDLFNFAECLEGYMSNTSKWDDHGIDTFLYSHEYKERTCENLQDNGANAFSCSNCACFINDMEGKPFAFCPDCGAKVVEDE